MSLLNKATEFKKYVRANADFSNADVPNTIEAEYQFIVPVLGDALYASLTAWYEANNVVNDDNRKLLEKVQAVIAPAALIHALPAMQTSVTSLGLISVAPGEARKAFQWEYRELVNRLYDQLYAAHEILIQFLLASGNTYAGWLDSEFNAATNCNFVRSGADMKHLVMLQQPNRCYFMLRHIIAEEAETFLKPALGEAFYDELNAAVKGTPTADQQEVIPKLRMALLRKAMAKSASLMSIRFNVSGGFTVIDKVNDLPDGNSKAAAQTELTKFEQDNEKQCAMLMSQVVKHLNNEASSSKYTAYFSSTAYTSPDTAPRKNDRKGMFVA